MGGGREQIIARLRRANVLPQRPRKASASSALNPFYYSLSVNWRIFGDHGLDPAAVIFSPASGLAWLGSEPMRPSGKRRR